MIKVGKKFWHITKDRKGTITSVAKNTNGEYLVIVKFNDNEIIAYTLREFNDKFTEVIPAWRTWLIQQLQKY